MASTAVNELGPMLTASEVAEMLHLHVNTVKRLGDRGELPFYRVCKRGDRRFRLDDVMAFLARNGGPIPGRPVRVTGPRLVDPNSVPRSSRGVVGSGRPRGNVPGGELLWSRIARHSDDHPDNLPA